MTKIYICKACDCVLMEDGPHTAIIKGEPQRHSCTGPFLVLARPKLDELVNLGRHGTAREDLTTPSA